MAHVLAGGPTPSLLPTGVPRVRPVAQGVESFSETFSVPGGHRRQLTETAVRPEPRAALPPDVCWAAASEGVRCSGPVTRRRALRVLENMPSAPWRGLLAGERMDREFDFPAPSLLMP